MLLNRAVPFMLVWQNSIKLSPGSYRVLTKKESIGVFWTYFHKCGGGGVSDAPVLDQSLIAYLSHTLDYHGV